MTILLLEEVSPQNLDLSGYRQIFCDLDNTIVTKSSDGLTIPAKVVAAINALPATVGFSICSARCLEEVEEIGNYPKISLRSPMILENGATVRTPDGTIISQSFLPEDETSRIISYLKKYSDIWKKVCIGGKLVDFDNIEKFDGITKIALQDLTEDMMQDVLGKLSEFSTISYFRSMAAHKPVTFTLDITSIHATKQIGVNAVLEYLKIGRDAVIGIGDSDNDMPMLMACGLKVAVANAKPSILELAGVVVPSCEAGGVAVLLNKLGKIEQ